jgi:Short C-terminal domain
MGRTSKHISGEVDMFVRRRPLLRAAVVGGGAYVAGKRRAEREAQAGPPQGPEPQDQISGMGEPQGGAPAGASSVSDQLATLTSLHQQGSLTDEEFAAAKSKLLGG